MRIAVVSCGTGNIGSIVRALGRAGCEGVVTGTPDGLDRFSHIILPGVGAFPACMARLRARGFVAALEAAVARGSYLLGICVGMQMLATTGREFGGTPGLNLVPGEVRPIPVTGRAFPVPRIGWDSVRVTGEQPLFRKSGKGGDDTFYFQHSFAFCPEDPGHVAAVASCGNGVEIVAAVCAGRVLGVQFHPEKSQDSGLELLANFAAMS